MKIAALSDCCELITDGTHYTPTNVGTGVPFLTVKDMSPQGLDFHGCSLISDADFCAARAAGAAPKLGDVLFSKDGTVGKVHLVQTNRAFAVLSSIAILRPCRSVHPGYLVHALRFPDVLGQALKKKTGSAIRRIILSDLKSVQIPLPPLEEQRRIAAILDKADALRQKRRLALQKLDSLAQSIFLDMFGDPRLNLKGFARATIDSVCEIVTDGEHLTPKRTISGIKLLSARNIQNGYLDFTDVDYIGEDEYRRITARCKPQKDDILLSCSGTIGRVSAIRTDEPLALVRSAALLRPLQRMVRTDYLEAWLQLPWMNGRMKQRANASSQANLFQNQIRDLPVLLPEISAQDDFICRRKVVATAMEYQASAADKLDELFSSLQSRAFRGEL